MAHKSDVRTHKTRKQIAEWIAEIQVSHCRLVSVGFSHCNGLVEEMSKNTRAWAAQGFSSHIAGLNFQSAND